MFSLSRTVESYTTCMCYLLENKLLSQQRHRKMYRNNLIDDDEEIFRERGYLTPM